MYKRSAIEKHLFEKEQAINQLFSKRFEEAIQYLSEGLTVPKPRPFGVVKVQLAS